jgi:nitrate/TMAO reductase-like tetraheme cytochrome c subunit
VRSRAVSALLWLAAWPLAAGPPDFGVPEPRGFVGTTSQWIQGVGFALAVLDFVLLVVIWRLIRKKGVTRSSKTLLLGAVVVIPAVVVFLATAHGMHAIARVEACGSCHAMDSHVADLRNPASDSLAAIHYKNRYIQEDQCYTCHSDYGAFGTLSAKLDGLGHVYHNLAGNYEKPIKVRRPYSNIRCLSCHGEAQNFLAKHEKEEIPKLLTGKDSCLDCHGPAHKEEVKPAAATQAMK